MTSIDYEAFLGCSGLTSVTIGNSVTSIGVMVFCDCSGLTSITIPNSVTSIGSSAFSGCSGLTSISIPSSVTSIDYEAFLGCSGLTSIIVESGNTHYDSRDNCNAIIETASNTLIAGCKSSTIPNSVTSIGEHAFDGCSGLTSITIPNSVTSIGSSAFSGCSGLTSITIPNSVTSIGEYAFWDCSGLTSITIPNSVTSIGDKAFYYCSGLTSITIPNSVTSIGESAFRGCSSLTSITIPNSVTSIGNYAFEYCSGLTSITNMAVVPQAIDSSTFSKYSGVTLHIPEGCKDAYAAASYWKNFTIVDDIPIIKVNAITLDKTVYSCAVGDVIQASVSSYLPTDATIQKVTWSVADPSIAFVDAKTGQFVGLQDGVTTITATAADGSGVTATAILKVGEGDATTYTITATAADASMGTVTGGGTYVEGAEVTLTATPNAGYEFKQWSNGSTENPYTFTATQDSTLTATFTFMASANANISTKYYTAPELRAEADNGTALIGILNMTTTGNKYINGST